MGLKDEFLSKVVVFMLKTAYY